ncbi:hypothetical protein FH972_006497 [Carpinus fangiana]|uniref:Uncharacterized protein n=1 Tax=Carpinus fangiana TaxID=176857 RepID=A0A5N6QSS2_9ROSI|nr:hypothetical protein FH972_006497 [Carpinus fangiana]
MVATGKQKIHGGGGPPGPGGPGGPGGPPKQSCSNQQQHTKFRLQPNTQNQLKSGLVN